MKELFNPEGQFMAAIKTFSDWLLLSMAAFICSAFIITLGPSLVAMCSVGMKLARGEYVSPIYDFCKEFKNNFKQGIIEGLVLMAAAGLLSIDLYFCITVLNGNYKKYLATLIVVVIIFVLMVFWLVFPITARFSLNIKEIFHNAVIMAAMNPFRAITGVIFFLMPYAAAIIIYPLLPLVLLFLPALPLYYNAGYYVRLFKRFEPDTDEEVM